jgi:hypothetical protein
MIISSGFNKSAEVSKKQKGILILPWGHWLIPGLWTNDKKHLKQSQSR